MRDKEQLTQVVKLVQKDLKSFEILYNHIINKVYYWCYMVVKDEGLAHDLAQDSMIKLYNKFHLLTNPETFGPWMYALVRNVCYDHLRANKQGSTISLESEPFLKEGLEEETMDYLPEESYSLEETKKLIMDFIEALPQKQREVITLFYLEEFKINEIASISNCSLGVIKSRLHAGRNNLEMVINRYQEKHGTKLYSSILLPFLGSIMEASRDEFCKGKKLKYEKNLYQSKSLFKQNSLKGLTRLNPLILVSVSLGLLIIVGVGTFIALNSNLGISKGETHESKGSVAAFDKNEKDPYVASVTYDDFPSRHKIHVSIQLKRRVSFEKIKILFKGERILFEQNGKQIGFDGKENGTYTLEIGKHKKTFEVNQIQPYAPEVTSIENKGTYLKLNISDELGQVNYENSYIEVKGKNYKITNDQKVWGQFTGKIKVYLYNQADQHTCYEFNLN